MVDKSSAYKATDEKHAERLLEAAKRAEIFIAGSAICMAFAAWNGAALAEPKANRQAQADSLGYQCRAAVRAEMKGPDCRMAIPPNPTSHCNIPSNAEVEVMDNKINECVKRGGPGRQAKTRS